MLTSASSRRHGRAQRPDTTARASRHGADSLVRHISRQVDAADPTPIYEQIAAAVRWEVGMGRCEVGNALPAIRQMASGLGVNFHTVRRAYDVLVREGVVASRRGGGTVIVRPPRREARGSTHVIAVECNYSQAAGLASDIAAAFEVTSQPWLLHERAVPPPGVMIGTPFHEAEMRRRWPLRRSDIHIVVCDPDPLLNDVVSAALASLDVDRLVLIERDGATARSMAREIGSRLPPGAPPLSASVASPANARPERYPDALLLFAPRIWEKLPWTTRSHPRALELRFTPREDSLAPVASRFGWRPRASLSRRR